MKNDRNETQQEAEASRLEKRREFLRILSGGAVLAGVGSLVDCGDSPTSDTEGSSSSSLPSSSSASTSAILVQLGILVQLLELVIQLLELLALELQLFELQLVAVQLLELQLVRFVEDSIIEIETGMAGSGRQVL